MLNSDGPPGQNVDVSVTCIKAKGCARIYKENAKNGGRGLAPLHLELIVLDIVRVSFYSLISLYSFHHLDKGVNFLEKMNW